MPKDKSRTAITSQQYKNFLRSLDLSWIALVDSKFSSDRKEYLQSKEHNLSVAWDCRPLQLEEKYFDLSSELELQVTSSRPAKVLLQISGIFHLHVHASPVSQKYVERFADSEVRLLIWP